MNERAGKSRRGTFLCFEGIDGAGKTTMATRLAKELRAAGIAACMVDKRSTNFTDSFASRQMGLLKSALWEYPKEANINVMGDRHWLHLIAAWYSALYMCKVRPLLEEGTWVIVDSWIYKYWARFKLKPEFGEGAVASCFAHIADPDIVLFLDVPAAIAARRRAVFKPSEMGRSDDISGPPVESFVLYQTDVRRALLSMATKPRWRHLDAGDMDETRVLASVLAELKHCIQD